MTYFNDMPSLFQNIAASQGQNINFTNHTPGGTGFVDHVINPTLFNVIRNNNFDIVVMQPGTGESAGATHSTSLTAQRGLIILDSLRKYNECIKAYLYEIPYGVVAENNYANYFGVQAMIEDSVTRIANLMHIPIVPAGECQFAYYQNNQDLLLNNTYNDVHPSYNGSYLVASCMYASIFKDSVSTATFTGTISSQNIAIFQNIVDSVVFQHSDLWMLNNYYLTSDFSFEQNGTHIQFNNLSQNYDSVFWDFGDNETSNEINPSHSYISNNNYIVTLTIYKGICTEQFTQTINIQTADIIKDNNSTLFEIYPNPTSDYIYVKSPELENCKQITLYSINGKLEKSIPFDNIFSIQDLNTGVYFIHFSFDKKDIIKKIIKL